MLKVGDILWTFRENDYFIGEVSKLSVVNLLGYDPYCFVSTNGIIGGNKTMLIPVTGDFNTLVKTQYYSETIYHTISESVAVNYIREHFDETNNQRNL